MIYDDGIKNLLKEFPRAKTAKIIKNLIDFVAKIEDTVDIQISIFILKLLYIRPYFLDLCEYLIEWCT